MTLNNFKKTRPKTSNSLEIRIGKVVGIGFAGLGVLITLYYIIRLSGTNIGLWTGPMDLERTGQLGDFIGGFVGAIWGLAGVILFYIALRLQSHDLELQREELAATRQVFTVQQFESTFFNLIKVQQGLLSKIHFDRRNQLSSYEDEPPPKGYISGVEFFEVARADFLRLYQSGTSLQGSGKGKRNIIFRDPTLMERLKFGALERPKHRIPEVYKVFYDHYHPYLGHYFRHLYFLLKLLDTSEKEETYSKPEAKNKIRRKYFFYAGVIQAQMSSPELFLLFYNAWCFSKSKRMVKKYRIVHNLAIEDLADSVNHPNIYGEGMLKRMDEQLGVEFG